MTDIRLEPWKNQSVDLLGFIADDEVLFAHNDRAVASRVSTWTQKLRSKKIKTEIICDGHWVTWTGLSSQPERHEKIRVLSKNFYHAAKGQGAKKAGLLLNTTEGAKVLPWILQGISLGGYRFDKYKSKKGKTQNPEIIVFVDPSHLNEGKKTAKEELALLDQVNFCRDLVNEPANQATPAFIAKTARTLAASSKMGFQILSYDELKRKGYNGLVSVGKGSAHPPCMVVLSYKPAKPGKEHLCLVGKGITFDSGGYCLKPPPDMWEMKTDMAGAGAVLYAMEAIARRKPSTRVTGILCLAENLIDANACRPGDIFIAKNGKSVHVGNTDAEGRLVITDGLYRAGEEKATHIVDVATLTGACVVALGNSITGLFGNDKEFSSRFLKAADGTGELYWELPLHQEYRDLLKSPYADINNVGNRDGGAIQAALFLKEFVPEKTKWIHLDIAGPAFTAKPWKYFAEGATGMAVRTLVKLAEKMG